MSVTWEKQRASISLSLDWDNIFKKGTTEQRRELLKAVTLNRDTIKFCTGSSYTGKWNALGMDVHGSYIFPHRCEYEGGFEDGRFHGRGTLSYPMGQKLEGLWHKGKMVSYNFSNVDGLGHNPDWNYCKMPDRRFVVSIRDGLQPAVYA
ncbi:MORN repeat-containing protein 5 [Asbolus verrucosus]|uniref:MORN repeat-containing protein 5 n=1 Tax=Asbolus verrucosus TaxID=1661398 RepID=A0A482W861_ASBVE|nr:MORN repeat-containing protein 5 [Asbolus verrucosus]